MKALIQELRALVEAPCGPGRRWDPTTGTCTVVSKFAHAKHGFHAIRRRPR